MNGIFIYNYFLFRNCEYLKQKLMQTVNVKQQPDKRETMQPVKPRMIDSYIVKLSSISKIY